MLSSWVMRLTAITKCDIWIVDWEVWEKVLSYTSFNICLFFKLWHLLQWVLKIIICQSEHIQEIFILSVHWHRPHARMNLSQNVCTFLSVDFHSWSSVCSFGFWSWAMSNVSFPTFRQMLQLLSWGWMYIWCGSSLKAKVIHLRMLRHEHCSSTVSLDSCSKSFMVWGKPRLTLSSTYVILCHVTFLLMCLCWDRNPFFFCLYSSCFMVTVSCPFTM